MKHKTHNKTHSQHNEVPEQKKFTEAIQTPNGIIKTLILLTLFSIAIGIASVYLYKLSSVAHDFAQGSGSLIQAIWGSAATIAASFVAIILASEALRMAKATNDLSEQSNDLTDKSNELTEISNKLQLTESEPYAVWMKLNSAILAIDQYSTTVKPLLGQTNGVITNKNRVQFECITYPVLEKLQEVYNSPIYHMLNQVQWQTTESIDFPNTYATPLLLTILHTYDYKSRIEKLPDDQVINYHNTHGRSIWSHLYDIRKGLSAIKLNNIQHFMDENIGVNWIDKIDNNPSNMTYLPSPPNYSSILEELKKLMATKKPN